MAETRNSTNQNQPGQNQPPPQESGAMQSQSKSQQQQQQQGQGRGIEPSRARPLEWARTSWEGSPFALFDRFVSDLDRIFGEFATRTRAPWVPSFGATAAGQTSWMPQVDVFEREGKLVVHAELAGIRPDAVRVNVDEDGILTIAGERRHEHEHERGGVYRCERSYGTFMRSIPLPEGVDTENVKASFEDGVLEVTIPLPQQKSTKGRTIPIGPKQGTGGGSVKH